MFEQIKAILVDEIGVPPEDVTPSATLQNDLHIGSLEFVNAVLVLEDTFGITTSEDELKKLNTVGDLTAYVEKLKS